MLKVANAAIPDEALDAQNEAMRALAGLPSAHPVTRRRCPTAACAAVVELAGTPHSVRLLTYVEGTPMTGAGYLAPVTARQFGGLAGRVCTALAGFCHPGADAAQPVGRATRRRWSSPSSCPRSTRLTASRVAALSAAADGALEPVATALPQQVIHADITDFNVVADQGPDARPVPAGIIDFGDLMHTWRAAEAAVTICSLLVKDRRAPLRIAGDVLAGFLAEAPLTEDEVDALWPMVAARACAGLVSTVHQLSSEPGNHYLHDNLAVDRAVFDMVEAIPLRLGQLAMRRAAGLTEPDRPVLKVSSVVLPGVAKAVQLDLSTTSALLDEGAWTDPVRVGAAVRDAEQRGPRGRTGVIPYGQPHVHRAATNSLEEPSTIHLGIDVLLPRGTECSRRGPAASLALGSVGHPLVGSEGWDVILGRARRRARPGARVVPGTVIAEVTDLAGPVLPDHVHVQVVRTGLDAPSHVRASLRPCGVT